MSCYHPLKAIQYKNIPTTVRTNYNLYGDKQEAISHALYRHPVRLLKKEEYDITWNDEVEEIWLSCGKCIGCRIDYSQQWANRIMLELQNHDPETCYFITLTFDDTAIEFTGDEEDNPYGRSPLPHVRRPFYDSDSGIRIGWSHSLSRIDLQLFMKRFRRSHPNDKIRFFACGEYGEESARPHYHLIVFGVHFDDNDLKFLKKSPLGYDYKVSKSLSEDWPYGYNIVAPVTWESACYVARYTLKKMMGPDGHAFYNKLNIEEPFTQMSRRPGIAAKYYENNPISKDTVNIVIGTAKGSKQFPPPRYLEKLFDLDDPFNGNERRKIRRLSAINNQNMVLRRTTVSREEYLKKQEKAFSKNIKVLNHYRNMI